MTDIDMNGEDTPKTKPENLVLSPDSLTALARDIGDKGTVLAMYLNVPTTRLVNLNLEARDKETTPEACTAQMLLLWKELRDGAKDKDKAADLERALREMGKLDNAEVVQDKYQSNTEMTADCFPAA